MDYIINDKLNIASILTDIVYDACGNTGVEGFRSSKSFDEVREEFEGIRFLLPDDFLVQSKENKQFWLTEGFESLLDCYIKDQKEQVSNHLFSK